jgi:UDP-N-acetylglucosamine 2-epimerase (non-hydrolysing)
MAFRLDFHPQPVPERSAAHTDRQPIKVVSVVGARPNFVKMAALMAEMRKHARIRPLLVHTGQHYDLEMSDFFFQELGIPQPDINLEVGSASAACQVAQIMQRLEPVLVTERPDIVVLVGDVNSTLAGALTACKLGIPVAHVEAGLRSFDRTMPEEINRVVTDAISDFLFVSEPSGVENLLKEGRPTNQIFLVGNVMIDTLKSCLARARQLEPFADPEIAGENGSGRPARFALVTLHRPSTVDNSRVLRILWQALEEIGKGIPIVFPVHPRTRKRLQDLGLEWPGIAQAFAHPNGIRLISPLSYLRFLHLESLATFVITDSGGIQEETTVLGVPCLTVRENTERPITLTEGTNTLVGLNPERLKEEAHQILCGKGKQGRAPALWDGQAAQRIVGILEQRLPPGSVGGLQTNLSAPE